ITPKGDDRAAGSSLRTGYARPPAGAGGQPSCRRRTRWLSLIKQVAVELCRRLDLEMIYRHDGHEVEGIIDADTKVFVRRRLQRAA
ncbi:hypothetical protein, partial [Amaricoccus sp.]|uniref:hypothetical protein n=1 Tax=Amaricoccus sp. TaxID=1872485 RepID=UPI001B6C2B8E